MRTQFCLKLAFLCTLFAVSFVAPIFAQAPSLAPADAFYVTAKTDFGNETFTVIRDGRIEEQFYFVPARPHVAIETRDGKQFPVFQLLSYQRKMPDNTLKQGGVLQMSVQMAVSKKTEDDILNTIRGKFPLSDAKKKHRLSPIQMKDAVISMYNLDGSMLDSAPLKEGVAPIFGNQQFPFMLNLTDLGTDVMEALCTSHGGLPVIVTYTFQGMTAPGGFKIEVNWDNCYKHFSTDTKLRANVGYANLGANMGADLSTIRDEMESRGMMKVTSLSNEALSDAALDAAMTPILSLITTELFDGIKAPEQISPAAAKEIAPPEGIKEPAAGLVNSATDVSKAAGLDAASTAATDAASTAASTVASTAGSAIPYVGTIMKVLDVAADVAKNTKVDIGASFAMKDAKLVKKGSFVYTYDRQAIVDRKSSFGGPIGIGSFDKKIQAECVTVLPPGNWEFAHYVLPPVGDPEVLGFKQMNLSVIPTCNGRQISGMPIEAAFFNRNNVSSWTDKSNKPVSTFLFPLKAVYSSPEYKADPSKFKFKILTEVIPVTGAKITSETEAPMFNGDLAMAPPSDLFEPVFVSADCLSFGPGADEVFVAKGVLKADKLAFNFKLDSNRSSQGFLIPRDAKSVKISGLQFISKSGKKYNWTQNDKELKDISPDLDVMFFDNDWQPSLDADAISSEPNAVPVR